MFDHKARTSEKKEDVKEEAEFARNRAEAAYLKYRQDDAQSVRERQQGSWKDWFKWL